MEQKLNIFEQAVVNHDRDFPVDTLIWGYLGKARTAKLTYSPEDQLYIALDEAYRDGHRIPILALRCSTSKHYDMYTKDTLYRLITGASKEDLLGGGYVLLRRLVKYCFDPAKVRYKRNELLANLDRALVITGAYKDFKPTREARYDILSCRFPDVSRYEKESLDDLDSYYDPVFLAEKTKQNNR